MPKLVAIQLETCHHNTDGVAWYAYYDGPLTEEDSVVKSFARKQEALKLVKDENVGLSVGEWSDSLEEVETGLSRHAGLRRYYAASAR